MPKKAEEYPLIFTLHSQANPFIDQVNPTIAAADFTLIKYGEAAAALTNTPTVSPAGSFQVVAILTATEMNCDHCLFHGHDAMGNEWQDIDIIIDNYARDIDDVLPAADYTASDNATIAATDGKVDTLLTNLATVDGVADAILAETGILTGGAGSRAVTIHLYETSTTTPIVGVNVAAYNAGGDLMAQGTSTAAGQVLFALADGAHTIRLSKAGVVFDVETITVSGNGTFTLYGLSATIPAPTVPNYCVVYETITNTTTRTAPDSVTATAKLTALPYNYEGQLFTGEVIDGTYAASVVSWQLPWGARALVSIPESNVLGEISVPATATARVYTLLA